MEVLICFCMNNLLSLAWVQTICVDLVASHVALGRYMVLIHDMIQQRAESWPHLGLPFIYFFLLSGSTVILKEVGRAKMQNGRALLPIKFVSISEDVSRIAVVMY